jgi:hypothetical protein
MSNGTIDPNKQKAGLTRETAAVLLLVIGVPSVFGGVGMIWGWGGILLAVGLIATAFGLRLAFVTTTDPKPRKG